MNSERGSRDYRVLILPPTRRDGEVTCEVVERAGIDCIVCNDPLAFAGEIAVGVGAVIFTDALADDPRAAGVTAALAAQPAWSDIPAILLSRADRQSAAVTNLVAALTNVTVLDRPTSTRTLVSSVKAAIRGRRRQYQLRDQLGALSDAEQALKSADQRKDEFLAMLAHELRNPLAPIRNATEILTRTLLRQGAAQAAVDIVKRQVGHLTRLVDDLLDVSRITQGRIQLQRRNLELGSIVAQALESAEPLIREKHHRVILTSSSQPLYVDGDSARLVQCVTNLLTNAVKYTEQAGEIRVDTRAEQSRAVISVSDNGIGIPADLLPRIFELFVQSARSLDRSEGGLGIGLSVVQKLVEMHGGVVEAASEGPGRGSTFTITLPQIAARQESLAVSAEMRWQRKRVLVVDDNVDAATSLVDLLRLDGHEVEGAYSAKQALESVNLFKPDTILLDIGLPDMDGYQVAKRIRGIGGSVRIIALTGYGQADDVQRAREAGFDAHMVKPVDLSALQRAICDEGTYGPVVSKAVGVA